MQAKFKGLDITQSSFSGGDCYYYRGPINACIIWSYAAGPFQQLVYNGSMHGAKSVLMKFFFGIAHAQIEQG